MNQFRKPKDIAKRKTTKKTYSFRLDTEVMDYLQSEADKAEISLNELIRSVLSDYKDYVKNG